MKLLDPKVDLVFNWIFGSERSKKLLISFINSLRSETIRRVKDISYTGPWIPFHEIDKGVYDIRAEAIDEGGERTSIVIKLVYAFDWKAHAFIKSGIGLSFNKDGVIRTSESKNLIVIILIGNQIRDQNYHTVFPYIQDTGNEFEVHVIRPEDAVSDRISYPSSDPLVEWLLFLLDYENMGYIERYKAHCSIPEPTNTFEYMDRSREISQIRLREEKAERDYMWLMGNTRKEARSDGR
ncbi:hypothetical protein FHS18_004033 [Paenibacillus phyllosphaerae]|uniref:Uncharacterized protein n=1 Tax=Paenibacillus phyllosphaerae TaxID=274593 RepID=A0A7W5B046_9BACL|nr:PD-(D/E)XK nuclease family transposase [Paenibacillus phyllosphaerae]MBB3111965.1 hypothetical protein [Paenibacillus phyllosphaerae]